jgi:hypothetical protein
MATRKKHAEDAPFLFTLPAVHGLSFGVLRRHFSDRTNDVAAYVASKLAPALPADESWRITAARADTLIPVGVPDIFINPLQLATSFAANLPAGQNSLLICLKVILDDSHPLHEGWERCRAFTKSILVEQHGLPTVLALHDPSAAGLLNPNPPHIHLMSFARRLAPRGWAERTSLARDEAHAVLADAWNATA